MRLLRIPEAFGHPDELDDLPPVLIGGYADVLEPSMRDGQSMRAWGGRYARLVLERP